MVQDSQQPPHRESETVGLSSHSRSYTGAPEAATRLASQVDVLFILRQVPALVLLDSEELVGLIKRVRLTTVARDRLVTLEGHPVDALYVVVSGCFKRFRTSAAGREQILALLGPGDTFGEVPLLDGSEDFASTQAMELSTLLSLPSTHFEALVSAGSIPLSYLHRTLTARIRHMAEIIDGLSFYRVAQRIAGLILEQPHPPNRTHLTQSTMAAMTGTTREVVARTIHELNESGAITVKHGRISIRDAALLRRIAHSGR